ncbi:unnamed protein product [Closterium sp. Yama58-4]|nr:unnamed protein product [Closterium sp. Yama58-4]
MPVVLSPATGPITCSHVRPSGLSQSSLGSLKAPRLAASARATRSFRVRSSAQSGEQETAESVAAAGERPMPNFTWTPSPASQSFRNGSRASPTGLVPFNSGAGGGSLSLQSISKEEALGVVISAAMGTGWKTMTGLEGPSAPAVDPVDSVDSLGMPILSPVSPRRTARVDFTCNKCGSRTRRAINPHAYREGTVFVQCQGCQVFHKLVDHLNLFHEFRGPVFHAADAGQHGFAEHRSVDVLGLDGDGGDVSECAAWNALQKFYEFGGPVFHASDAGQHGFAEHRSMDVLGVDAGRDGDGGGSSGFDFPRF